MTNDKGSPPEVGPVKAVIIKVLRGTIALLETAVAQLEAPPTPSSGGKISNLPGWVKATVLATLALVTVWGVTALFPRQPTPEVALGGAAEQETVGLLEQETRGLGDGETGGLGDGETGEPGDGETGEPGDQETRNSPPVSESPPLRVTPSPSPPVSESPRLPVSESAEPSPETLPEPELQLTPEQVLIAAIESQVQNVTNKLGNGLIRSIQADFVRSKLVVLLSNEWYNLTSDRQDQLASEMLLEARGLDFQSLEITDSERHLLARSPVVGSGMIILRRSLSPNT